MNAPGIFHRFVSFGSALFLILALAGTNRCQEDYEFAVSARVRTGTPDEDVITRTPTSGGTVATSTPGAATNTPDASNTQTPLPTATLAATATTTPAPFALFQALEGVSERSAAGSDLRREDAAASFEADKQTPTKVGVSIGSANFKASLEAALGRFVELNVFPIDDAALTNGQLLDNPLLVVLEATSLAPANCVRIAEQLAMAGSGARNDVFVLGALSDTERDAPCMEMNFDAVVSVNAPPSDLHRAIEFALGRMKETSRGGNIVIND